MCSQQINAREEGFSVVWSLLNASSGHGQSEKEASNKVAQPRVGNKLDPQSLDRACALRTRVHLSKIQFPIDQMRLLKPTGHCVFRSDFPLCCEKQQLEVAGMIYKPF